jgi:hypothetical protein
MVNGLVASGFALLPNVIWFFFPPQKSAVSRPPEPVKSSSYRILEIVEWASRMCVFVLPFFSNFHLSSTLDWLALLAAAIFLGLYYFCWARYFWAGRKPEQLYQDLWRIPLPLSIIPVLFFLVISLWLGSWIMTGAVLVFGAAHITVNRLDKMRLA